MKKLAWLLFVLALPAGSQISNPSVVAVPSTPSTCSTLPLKVVAGTANVYGTNGSGGCTQVGGASSLTLSGDVTGTANANKVVKINGAPVPALCVNHTDAVAIAPNGYPALESCKIPAGTLTANSIIEVRALAANCTAAGVPFNSCVQANAHVCQFVIGAGTTSSAPSTFNIGNTAAAGTASSFYIMSSTMEMQNSLSSESYYGTYKIAGYSSVGTQPDTALSLGSLNSASDIYILAQANNNNANEGCGFRRFDVFVENP